MRMKTRLSVEYSESLLEGTVSASKYRICFKVPYLLQSTLPGFLVSACSAEGPGFGREDPCWKGMGRRPREWLVQPLRYLFLSWPSSVNRREQWTAYTNGPNTLPAPISWCGPCEKDHQDIDELRAQYRPGIATISSRHARPCGLLEAVREITGGDAPWMTPTPASWGPRR